MALLANRVYHFIFQIAVRLSYLPPTNLWEGNVPHMSVNLFMDGGVVPFHHTPLGPYPSATIPPWDQTPQDHKSGQYTSCLNAFLFRILLTAFSILPDGPMCGTNLFF